MKTLLLIDSHSLIYRAYHALPAFTTKTGQPINAVYGFASMLLKTIQDFSPTHVVVCFDTPKPTFRKKIFKEYQIQRPEMEDKLKDQLPLIKDFLESASIAHAEKPGFEADDVMGTLAASANKVHLTTLILTGDRDIVQLVDQNTRVIATQTGLSKTVLYDTETIAQKFGVLPHQIPDLKALMGDPSDNYPGVPGIGPKTAAGLITSFESLEKLYENLEDVKEVRIKAALTKHKKSAFLSKRLATIVRDVDLDFDIDSARFEGYNEKLKEFFEKIGFKSLTKRYFATSSQHKKKNERARNTESKKDKKQLGLF